MTFQLLSVLSAAALMATGIGATGETRSAQSLPAQNLALAQTPAIASGKLHATRHLADAVSDQSDQSDESNCKRSGGHWDEKHLRCRRGGWWFSDGSRLLIGAGTVAGIIVALSESNNNSISN